MRQYGRGTGPRRSRLWIAVVVAAVVVVGSIAAALWFGPPPQKPAPRARSGGGCETSGDCPEHSVCAAGGCIVLLPTEFETMWEEDVAAQLDPAVAWKPPSFFGEKLLPADVCPAPAGTVTPPDENHVQTLVKTTVFDFGGDETSVHRQLKTKGTMWFESLRFWLPPGFGDTPDPGAACVSSGVLAAAPGRGKWRGRESSYVDVSLPQAIPVGQETRVAVSVNLGRLPADEQGYRTLELGLDPVFDSAVERTVVALPLGTDVAALDGVLPARQRLLTGYVAYVWEHRDAPGNAAVRFRLPARQGHKLDIREINP